MNIEVDPKLFAADNGPLAGLLASVFEATAADVRRSSDAGLIQLPATALDPPRNFVLKRGLFMLSARDVPRFVAGFNALLDKLDTRPPAEGDLSYGCTVAFYPRASRADPVGERESLEPVLGANPGELHD